MTKILFSSLGNGVIRIVLNRPEKRNALSLEVLEELLIALKEVKKGAKALLLTGAGKNFCSGLDLKELSEQAFQKIAAVYLALAELPCPTIALVEGAAAAGGIGLIAACDLVYADPEAVFFLPELKKGVQPALVRELLSSILSDRHFRELAFTCSKKDAAWAMSAGLITGVGLAKGEEALREVLSVDFPAFQAFKSHLNRERNLKSRLEAALLLHSM